MTETVVETAGVESKQQQLAGKYLTFGLADEEYGVEITKVREIIKMMDITSVPRTPEFVKGVINLRGKVIPVVDLRLKFSMAEAEHTDETCIVVVDVNTLEMGTVVDKVSEVLDIDAEDIEETPSFGVSVDTSFILGIGKKDDQVTILLDISKVLSSTELCAVEETAASFQETED